MLRRAKASFEIFIICRLTSCSYHRDACHDVETNFLSVLYVFNRYDLLTHPNTPRLLFARVSFKSTIAIPNACATRSYMLRNNLHMSTPPPATMKVFRISARRKVNKEVLSLSDPFMLCNDVRHRM